MSLEKEPTICLNMIVKNESKIIERMLETVVSIIDCYCICDTGSTDNTVEIIQAFFDRKKIKGKIIFEPFLNFAHNRNVALDNCNGMSDYILLMDADMILQIHNFKKTDLLQADNFSILQGIPQFYYSNVRIVKNNNKNKYIGVTHEYVDLPTPVSLHNFPKDKIFIYDKGDGGSKANKLERDIRLLKEGIEKEPQHQTRYYFYLANTYFDSGNVNDAIETYKKRITFGGWEQEMWYCYFRIGLAYKKLNDMNNAISWWLDGYNYYPYRIENMFEMVMYYRSISKHKLCNLFIDTCKNIITNMNENKVNKDTFIFLQNDVYTYLLDFERIVIAGYLGKNDLRKEIVNVLNNSDRENEVSDTFSNMKFCKYILTPILKKDFSSEFINALNENNIRLFSSSSCMLPNKNGEGYIMNERLVNYKIDERNGNYENCEKHIISYNRYYELSPTFQITKEKLFDITYENKRFLGVEDIRIFHTANTNNELELEFLGVTLHSDNRIGVVGGIYDISAKEIKYNELKTNFNNLDCEKNWVFINYKKETCIVYSWWPLRICKLNKMTNKIDLLEEKLINAKMFRFARGSTSGFYFNNEYWFIIHIVAHDRPRNYYHNFAVFDENMNLLRYSAPFKFEGASIEYCLGLIVEKDRVIVNYSTWDRTNKLAVYDKKYIDQFLQFFE